MNVKTTALSAFCLFMPLLVSGETSSGCRLLERDKEISLENDYFSVVIQPERGGKGSAFIYKKTGENLTGWPDYGILEDRFWVDRTGNDFPHSSYTYKIVENTLDRLELLLTCRGKGMGYSALVLEKTVVVVRQNAGLQVSLKLRNEGATSIPVGLWVFQHLLVPGRNNVFYKPGTDGITALCHYKKGDAWEGYWDSFLYDFSRGWTGFVADSGTGAVCLMNPTYVSCLYNCARTSREASTTEWIYNKRSLEPGRERKTEYTILPFKGLPSIDGAGNNAAGAIILEGKPEIKKPVTVKAVLASGIVRNLEATLLTRKLPSVKFSFLEQKKLNLPVAEAKEQLFSYIPELEGTYVMRIEVRENNNLLFDMEKLFVIGQASGKYQLARDFSSEGELMAEFKPKNASPLDSYLRHTMVSDCVTPHQAWAKPYAKGKIKVLMTTVPSCGRELIELDQRMDMEYSFIVHTDEGTINSWNPAYRQQFEAEEWEKKLADRFDLFFIEEAQGSTLPIWASYPTVLKQKILQTVEKGTGLVYIGYGQWWKDKEDPLYKIYQSAKNITDIHREFSPDLIPEIDGGNSIKMGQYGKGKVIFLELTNGKSQYEGPKDVWGFTEYFHAFLARVLTFAAGKNPDLAVDLTTPVPLVSATTKEAFLELGVSAPQGFYGTLRLVIRDRFGQTETEQKKPITQANNRLSFPLVSLKRGLHVAEIQVKNNQSEVMTWGAKTFAVESPVKLTRLELGKEKYLDGETIAGAVSVESTDSTGADFILVSELWDTNDRCTAKTQQKVRVTSGKQEVAFQLALPTPLTKMHTVKVKLYEGDTTLDELRRDILTPPVEKDSFFFGGYKTIHARLKDFGFNTVVSGIPDEPYAREVAKMNMNFLVWSDFPDYRFVNFAQSDISDLVRKPCLTDPLFLEKLKSKWKCLTELYTKYDVIGHIANDEWSYDGGILRIPKSNKSDLCHSSSCLKGFREYVQAKYKDIATLNQSWESDYKEFGEIEPPLYADIQKRIREVDKGKDKKFTDWQDHQMFKETVIADIHGFCHRAVDHKIKYGTSGTQDIATGYFVGWDWWKQFGKRNMTCISMYGGLGEGPVVGEIVRSFAQPGDFISDWSYGYDSEDGNEKNCTFGPWYLLFHDGDGMNFCIGEWGPEFPMLFPDWMPRNQTLWLKEQADRINKGGIGNLIQQSEREKAEIAIHYSQASLHANRLLGMMRGGVPTLSDAWGSAVTLIHELGFQADFLSYEQVEQGKLFQYKVFVMPFSHWVSKKEAEAIEAFAKNGGLVISDLRCPAIGKMLDGADLDPLFGIKQKGFPSFRMTPLKMEDKTRILAALGCREISTTTGKPLATFVSEDFNTTIPAVIANSIGSGKAVYLNLSFADFRQVKAGGVGGEVHSVEQAKEEYKESIRALLRELLFGAGLKPATSVMATTDAKNWYPEIVRYRNGKAQYVAILHCEDTGRVTEKDHKTVTISFGKDAHVYDMIRKKYYGKVATVKTEATDGMASLWALLPGKVSGLKISMKNSYAAGECIHPEVVVSGGEGGVATVVLLDPSGKEQYRSHTSVKEGKAVFAIPLALNDVLGEWTAQATDVATGVMAKKTFRILPAPQDLN